MNHIFHIGRLYNIMSLGLKKILDRTSEQDFEKMRNIQEEYERFLLSDLKQFFPDLFEANTLNVAQRSEWHLQGSPLLNNLKDYIASAEDMEELILLLRQLDLFLADSVYDCVPPDEETFCFESLNDNYAECGLYLLPRLGYGWEHKNRDAYTSYSMLYYLNNFYYVCKEELKEFHMKHILLPKLTFHDAIQRGELRVAVSPVTGENVARVTKPYIREKRKYISVLPIEKCRESALLGRLLKVLEKASEQEADIVLFPELLGSALIQEELEAELEERNVLKDNEFPRLTVCPSIWKDRSNSCKVLNAAGEAVLTQKKHYGAELKIGSGEEKSAKEDIESDRGICILHCRGIGRIGVAICKDFLMTSYLGILAGKLRLNLLLVPSFTPKDYQFQLQMPKYGDLDCNVVWINSCAARWMNEGAEMKGAVTRAYMPGRKGICTKEAVRKELCGKRRSCSEACIYTYRISLDAEV